MSKVQQYQYDVFLSFTGADREKKDAIKARLESLGLSYYDSDLYCKGQFREDFLEALDQSRVYLLILSDHLRNDPNVTGKGTFTEVRRECSNACELEARGQLNILILCLSEFFRYTDGFHDYNDTIGWFFYTHTRGFSYVAGEVDAEGALTDKCLSDLTARAKSFVDARCAGKPVPSQKPRLEIAEEKLPERLLFKGRQNEIIDAMDAFAGGKQVVVLSGIGGIGKTALATEIARQCEEQGFLRCPQIVHVQELAGVRGGLHTLASSVSYDKTVYDSLASLGERDKYERKLSALAALPETVLLVVDNYNAMSDRDVREVLARLKCRVLITTRAQIDMREQNVEVIKLDCLGEEEAKELFYEICHTEISEEEFKRIYRFVGGHTITLCIMARMLNVHKMSVPQLLAEMESPDATAARVEFSHNEYDAADTVLGHLSNLFGISNFDEGCKQILRAMSILSDGTIPVEDLMAVLGLRNRNEINALVTSGWLEMRKQGTEERLYLHPILSRLMAITLVPTEENVGGMVSYLAEGVGTKRESMTYADAVLIGDRLYYACYVLAGGSSHLSTALWKRFTQVNYLLGDAEDVQKKVEALSARLSDQSEVARIQAYGDMVTIEQYPTRVEVLDKYLNDLAENAHDYKWVLRCLSVTIRQVYGIEKYRPFLSRALEKAMESAIRRKDDFAVCDLLIYAMELGENPGRTMKQVKRYIRERKREGMPNGDLTYLEFITVSMSLLGAQAGVESMLKKSCTLITDGYNTPVRFALKNLLLHPTIIFRVGRIIYRVSDKEDSDVMERILQLQINAVQDDALHAGRIIEAAVMLHKERWEREVSLASTVEAMEGVLRLLQRLPEAMVQKHTMQLTEHIDTENLTISDLSNLQVAALINRTYGDSSAVAQSRQVLQAVLRLRPTGHSDVIDALVNHGEVCFLFNQTKEGMRAYADAWKMLTEKDQESNRAVELADKMLRVPAVASACSPSTLHDWILAVATRDLAAPSDAYYDLLYAYAKRLVSQAVAGKVTPESDYFGELWRIAEQALGMRGVKRLGQNSILGILEHVIFTLSPKVPPAQLARPMELLEKFAKHSRIRSVRRSASIRLAYLQAKQAEHENKLAEAGALFDKIVGMCVRWNMHMGYASISAYRCMCARYSALPADGDPFTAFVKSKRLLDELNVRREKLIKTSMGADLAGYLKTMAKLKLTKDYGITQKQFGKLRTKEQYYALIFRKLMGG